MLPTCSKHPRYMARRYPYSECPACLLKFMHAEAAKFGLRPGTPDREAGVLLLASLRTGPNMRRLAAFTGYGIETIRSYRDRLVKGGVWRGGKVYGDWADKKAGGVAFPLDVCVATGALKRVPAKDHTRA